MKLKTFIVTAAIGFGLCSCDGNEPKYSCDDNVDSWVKEHIDEIHGMTRAEWLETDAKFSLAIYRAFTYEQRIEFWREKFHEVMQLPWEDAELTHIQEAEKFFEKHLELFKGDKLSDSQLDEVEVFLYKWRSTAQKELGWKPEVVSAIIASGDKVLNTHGKLAQKAKTKAGNTLSTTSESSHCNCHVGSIFTCDQNTECLEVQCNETSMGCGGFLIWSCNGRCEEPGYAYSQTLKY